MYLAAAQRRELGVAAHGKRVALKRKAHRRHGVARLVHCRVQLSVAAHQTVKAEVAVVGLVAEIAAVAKHALAHQPQVGVVPNKPADKTVVFVNKLPVLRNVAQRIAHCVGVLAQQKRELVVFFETVAVAEGIVNVAADRHRFLSGNVREHARRLVHARHHVAAVEVTFVMYRTGGVNFLAELRHFEKGLALARLVAKRPHKHRRVVFVAVYHYRQAVEALLCPHRLVAGDAPGGAVGFEVILAHHQQAVAVAQLQHGLRRRVVTGAHGVEVVLFDYFYVALVEFPRDGKTVFRVEFVAVDAANFYRHAVKQQKRSQFIF